MNSGANNNNGSKINVAMTTETKAKVFKSELVVMSLQPAAPSTTAGKLTLQEENAEQKKLSHQLQPQLKSPTKITLSSSENSPNEHDSTTTEGILFVQFGENHNFEYKKAVIKHRAGSSSSYKFNFKSINFES